MYSAASDVYGRLHSLHLLRRLILGDDYANEGERIMAIGSMLNKHLSYKHLHEFIRRW